MNKPDKTPAYFINGKRLSQLKRPALLVLARELHEDMRDWTTRCREATKERDVAFESARLYKMERDMAEAAALRITMSNERDRCEGLTLDLQASRQNALQYLLQAEAAESSLSMEQARVVSRDERIAFLRKRLTRWAIFKQVCVGVFWVCVGIAGVRLLWS